MKDESWVINGKIFFSSREVWVVRHERGAAVRQVTGVKREGPHGKKAAWRPGTASACPCRLLDRGPWKEKVPSLPWA